MVEIAKFTEQEKASLLSKLPSVIQALQDNCRPFPQYPECNLLIPGDDYYGIWIEHNQDNVFFADYNPVCAWATQDVFLRTQREDGLLPFMLTSDQPWEQNKGQRRFGQLQLVYPFARCAFEVAKKVGRPESDIRRVYDASAAYDNWLVKYRNRAGSGLVEMYCEWDTGHDNDPRVTDGGIPHDCPGQDAKNMPDLPIMPILSVDLSAMRYGGLLALAEMAELLGLKNEAGKWRDKAETLRRLIKQYLFDEEDCFYYDRDTQGLRKYRTEHITRLFLNHVLTQDEFDAVYERYFGTPGREFNPAYPIPSVSVDDPHFDKACPKNSWGSNCQATTAERAMFWMDFYGRPDDLTGLLSKWLRSICDNPETATYQQEINPFTGKPVGVGKNYSPTLNLAILAMKRLGWI